MMLNDNVVSEMIRTAKNNPIKDAVAADYVHLRPVSIVEQGVTTAYIIPAGELEYLERDIAELLEKFECLAD